MGRGFSRRAAVALCIGMLVAGCGTRGRASDQQLPPIVTTTSTTTTTSTVPQDRFHTVQRGEILAVIAATYGVTIDAIVEINGLANPDDIQAGQVLEIPPNVRTDVVIEDIAADTTAADTTAADTTADGTTVAATDP